MNGQSSKLKTTDTAVQVANNQGVVLTVNILNSGRIDQFWYIKIQFNTTEALGNKLYNNNNNFIFLH